MLVMRAVPEAEYARLEEMVMELARYHGTEEAPDAAGLCGLLWGPRALGRAFFFEEGEALVAYAILSEFGRFHAGTRALELVHLGVREARRGGGLGQQIMAQLEEWALAEGHDRIVLTAGTERAQGFYEKIGYEKMDPAQRYRRVFG